MRDNGLLFENTLYGFSRTSHFILFRGEKKKKEKHTSGKNVVFVHVTNATTRRTRVSYFFKNARAANYSEIEFRFDCAETRSDLPPLESGDKRSGRKYTRGKLADSESARRGVIRA